MSGPCPQCEAAAGRHELPGGLLVDRPDFVVHAPIGGCPLPGWLVVAPRRHVEALTELSPSERAELFALGARLDQLLRGVLGAQKVYLAVFAEVVAHTHLHVIPRFADTPADLRGPRCFLATPDRHLAADQVAATIEELRRHLEAESG